MDKGFIERRMDRTRAPARLQGAVVHELTHARNLDTIAALLAMADTDNSAFVDVAFAQQRTAITRKESSRTLRSYVAEMTARHVHGVILQELQGTPGNHAVRFLHGHKLAAAALLYFVEIDSIWDVNGLRSGHQCAG